MEYRHGPISITGPNRVVWWLGGSSPDPALTEQIGRTGGRLVAHGLDPLAELILVQRLAVAMSMARGLHPDHPRNLTRSVILS
ncbi:MAG TPA: hypothetical protein VGP70_04140 [Actinomadura sp.]|nr:hypothetical protein [Actinomadura sp.]